MAQARYENEEFWLRDSEGRELAMLHVEALIEYERGKEGWVIEEGWEISQVAIVGPKGERLVRSGHNDFSTTAELIDLVDHALTYSLDNRADIEATIVEHEQRADEEAADYQIEQRREALIASEGR